MQIRSYSPQKHIELVHIENEPLAHTGNFNTIGFVILLVILSVFFLIPNWMGFPWLFNLFWRGIIVTMFAVALYFFFFPPTNIIYLKADASQQKIIIKTRSERGKEKNKSFSSSDIQKFFFSIENRAEDESPANQKDYSIKLQLFHRSPKNPDKYDSFESQLIVKHVDLKEEVIDLGMHIASILGMKSAEIISNDHKESQFGFYTESRRDLKHPIDLDKEPEWKGYGEEQVANLKQLYRDDKVEKDRRLTEIITEDWDPETHHFHGKILENQAGHILSYKHSGGSTELVVFLVFLTVVFSIVGFFTWESLLQNIGILLKVLIGFIVVVAFSILTKKKSSFRAVTWTWNWNQGILLKQIGSKKERYPFSELESIRFVLDKTYHSNKSSSSSTIKSSYYTYNGHIYIQRRGQSEPLEIASTGEVRDSSSAAYKSGVSFANMLSQKLDISVEFIDET